MPSPQPQLTISTRDGDFAAAFFTASSHLADGDETNNSRGTLVVIHDIGGLDDATREAAARLAQMGYVVLAPDFFALGGGPKETTESALADHAATLSDARVVSAIIESFNAVAAQAPDMSTHVGVLGWGWGGAYALMAASHDARFRVACDIGGVISYAVSTPQNPGSPLNFVANIEGALFAAFPGNDPDFPDVEIGRLRGRLVEHDKRGEVRVYPDAPPRFWRDASLPQTQALWRRLENFLDEHIGDGAQDEFVSSTEYLDEHPDAGYPNEESRLHA